MNSVDLYEEFRFIERNENEVSVVWKGAHLILFFLTFVFGSFCTFFFHVLMYMFDQKCVLFPEIVPHSSLRKIVYDFFTINAVDEQVAENATGNELPVDFLSTQWKEDSVCYLPTYVPLVSGLGGLIWTIMFLMCSSGTSSPAGMQRQWRALPSIFVFSVAVGSLCIYSSTITSNGLEALCINLGHLTGSNSCSYTINVATLGYERRIRGVYQATRLTIATAWLHTTCWLLSAVLTFVRVLFAVDFQLVRVNVRLIGNIERMMEKYERHVRNVSPDSTALTEDRLSYAVNDSSSSADDDEKNVKEKEREKEKEKGRGKGKEKDVFYVQPTEALFISEYADPPSTFSLVPDESRKLFVEGVSPEHQFIVKLLLHLIDHLEFPSSEVQSTDLPVQVGRKPKKLYRQHGQANIITTPLGSSTFINATDEIAVAMDTPEAPISLQRRKKSNLKTKGTQASSPQYKVQISENVTMLKDVEENENQSEFNMADEIEDESEDESEDENEDVSDNDDDDGISTRDVNDQETQTPKAKQD